MHWELFGAGDRTVFFLPAWSIVHARQWKLQVADLARDCRVLVMDGRGNGESDRPVDRAAYADEEYVADALAVMDASATDSAAIVGFSAGARWALSLAANHPERVSSVVFVSPAVRLSKWNPVRQAAMEIFEDDLPEHDGWLRYNAGYWRRHYRDFLEFFFESALPEPHSTKPIEDAVGYGLETTPEVLIATARAPELSESGATELAGKVRCPVLVIHGDEDEIVLHANGANLAELTGGRLLTFEGTGHCPHLREPVAFNQAVREFVLPPTQAQARRRGPLRKRRALYVSSPIGLGHARRDVAIARDLRRLVPGLEIDWLAQDPVTRVLQVGGERIHPLSSQLANESTHIESETQGHRLHVFEAWRRMDEILLANFMVFMEAVRRDDYDAWIGDEAWEVDHYLHENPELKRAAYVWLTDFVGWLPMPDLGDRDAVLTADYNAEMIEHIERFPRLRDRAIFIGKPEDIVPDTFGADLPAIREWTQRHYDFTGGYILGADPAAIENLAELRARLGYGDDETVCVASVGGSGVGAGLLARLIESYPAMRQRVPRLRMIAVAGPRIDPASLPRVDGVEVRPFVPDLNLHLAACDVALTQGGLTTTMELVAARRPFIYFPLRDHCEQNFHVRHRLDRYRAGRCMTFEEATPEALATEVESLLSRPVDFAPIERGTATRAAESIAELF